MGIKQTADRHRKEDDMKNTSINWCIENCAAFEMSDDAKKEMAEIVAFIDEAKTIINEKNAKILDLKRNKGIDEMTARIAKLEPALGEVIQMLEDCDAGNHGLLLTKAENKKLYEFKDLLKGR